MHSITFFLPLATMLHANAFILTTRSHIIVPNNSSPRCAEHLMRANAFDNDNIIIDSNGATFISSSTPVARSSESATEGSTVQSLTKPKPTDFPTWKRRLDTHEDPFNIHKWAGLGWMLTSVAIFGCGAFSGFTEVPDILEPITYIFLISTLTQSLTSIPMALKYRAHEPSIQRGFISSALASSSLAFTGFWLGPFGDRFNFVSYLPNLPDLSMGVVVLLTLVDALYNLNAFADMKDILAKINEMDPIKDSKGLTDKAAEFIGRFPVGLPMNVAMLQQLWVHASDARIEFLDILVSRGSSSDLVFYASMITSIAICVGNLTATLAHRKLISADVNNFATVSALVATLVLNIRAAGIDSFP